MKQSQYYTMLTYFNLIIASMADHIVMNFIFTGFGLLFLISSITERRKEKQ